MWPYFMPEELPKPVPLPQEINLTYAKLQTNGREIIIMDDQYAWVLQSTKWVLITPELIEWRADIAIAAARGLVFKNNPIKLI